MTQCHSVRVKVAHLVILKLNSALFSQIFFQRQSFNKYLLFSWHRRIHFDEELQIESEMKSPPDEVGVVRMGDECFLLPAYQQLDPEIVWQRCSLDRLSFISHRPVQIWKANRVHDVYERFIWIGVWYIFFWFCVLFIYKFFGGVCKERGYILTSCPSYCPQWSTLQKVYKWPQTHCHTLSTEALPMQGPRGKFKLVETLPPSLLFCRGTGYSRENILESQFWNVHLPHHRDYGGAMYAIDTRIVFMFSTFSCVKLYVKYLSYNIVFYFNHQLPQQSFLNKCPIVKNVCIYKKQALVETAFKKY